MQAIWSKTWINGSESIQIRSIIYYCALTWYKAVISWQWTERWGRGIILDIPGCPGINSCVLTVLQMFWKKKFTLMLVVIMNFNPELKFLCIAPLMSWQINVVKYCCWLQTKLLWLTPQCSPASSPTTFVAHRETIICTWTGLCISKTVSLQLVVTWQA